MNSENFNADSTMDRIVEQRYNAAVEAVTGLRESNPGADSDALARKLIIGCARDLAMSGAVTGGAAAAPTSGTAGMAAGVGDIAFGTARLGEMVMAIGIVNGLDSASARDRSRWLGAVLGASEGFAAGLTGVAARAGSQTGGRMLGRMATAGAAAGAGRTKRAAARMATKGGPWSLAALLPYGIGAGVGAASNAALAVTVGRAARSYFATGSTGADGPGAESAGFSFHAEEEVWEAEFIEEEIHDQD